MASVATAIAYDAAMRDRAPELAVKIWPSDGLALANLALRRFMKQVSSQPEATNVVPDAETIALSRRALITEPLASDAVTLIALAATAPHRRFFLLQSAARIDKRNALAQSQLLFEYVDRGRNGDAVTTMYRILKVHPEQRDGYVTALAQSLAQVGDQSSTVALLKKDPELANAVLRSAAKNDVTVGAAARVRIQNRSAPLADQQTDQAILAGLSRTGALDSAFQFYGLLKDNRVAHIESTSDDVDSINYPPFDWSFENSGRLSAQRAGGPGIRFVVPSANSGLLASRLIKLPPGAYTLRTSYVTVSGDLRFLDLDMSFQCADPEVRIAPSNIKIGGIENTLSSASTPQVVIPASACRFFRISLFGSGIRSRDDIEFIMRGATLVTSAGGSSGKPIAIL